MQQGSDYLLVPKRGRPVELTSNASASWSQNVGHQVKVHGHETYAGEGANTETDYAMAADSVELVAPSCAANWNQRWVSQLSVKQ